MFGGGIGYVTTKLRGAIMGKTRLMQPGKTDNADIELLEPVYRTNFTQRCWLYCPFIKKFYKLRFVMLVSSIPT